MRKRVKQIEQAHDAPDKSQLESLRKYAYQSSEEQQTCRSESGKCIENLPPVCERGLWTSSTSTCIQKVHYTMSRGAIYRKIGLQFAYLDISHALPVTSGTFAKSVHSLVFYTPRADLLQRPAQSRSWLSSLNQRQHPHH